MGKYTIQQLAEILVKKNGLNEKEAQDFVVAIFEIVKEGLEQDKLVKIKGFGTFKIIDIDPRASINVNTGERVLIEGHQKITFTPDAVMKEMVNRPFSQFETVILNDGVDLSEIDRTYNFEPDNNTGVEESETEQDTQETQDNTQETQDNTQDTQDTQTEVSTEKTTIVEEPEPTIVETTEEPEPTIVETTEEPEPPSITSEEVPAREAVTDSPCDQEEEDDDDDDTASPDVFDDDSETSGSYWKWVVAAVVCLILMAAAAYGGYMFGLEEGKHQEKKSQIADYAAQLDKQTAELRKQRLANQEQVLADTSATAKKVADTSATAKKVADTSPTKKEVSATSPATQSATSTPSAEEDYSRYNTSDVRIRTGAYIIVGIDKTVTAQEGQTIGKIAQSQLGPGMSCYVEAVNGMKENTVLKKGTRIKIPKLRHKKKKLPVNR
ncbi:MAG: HU family DNA-binding protein [Prevotella sp.]|nr:HU family DNA-binding protein [Prevotella sp.]